VVEFPSYYSADLGEHVTCNLQDKDKKTVEILFCDVQWDWSLKIWGPRQTFVKNTDTFSIVVNGVIMNNPASAKNLYIGFTDTNDMSKVKEFALVTDTVAGTYPTKTPINVFKAKFVNSYVREICHLNIDFMLPVTQSQDMDKADYVMLQLQYQFRNETRELNYPSALKDGTWAGSVVLKEGTTSIGNVIDFTSGPYIMIKLV
jgi:hypothetical protein